jgi:hypothetical protein
MLKAHGGPKDMVMTQKKEGLNTRMLVHDTMAGMPRNIHMKHLDLLVQKTQGETMPAVMAGVIVDTKHGIRETQVREHEPLAKGVRGKTHPKRSGQVAYSGPEY